MAGLNRFAQLTLALAATMNMPAFAQAPLPNASLPTTAIMEMDLGLPGHTVYRPRSAAKGQRLPVIAFGNGGCADTGNLYPAFLGFLAAKGYLVIAGGPIEADAGNPLPPGTQARQNHTEQMFQSIDWAIAENARAGSPYQGRLDTSKIAVMGHSCGGLQAIAAGADPRITTVLVLNSGIIRGGIPNPDGTVRTRSYLPAGEEDLPRLHTPMLYVIGGPTDQAWRGAEGDFEAIRHVPVFNANLPIGHKGSWREVDGGEMGKVAAAWLDWRLKGDAKAARMFEGSDCGLCTAPGWSVKKRNMP